jgi:hypothetical protein
VEGDDASPSALGPADSEQPVLEVDVLPVEAEQLRAAKAGVGEEGEQEPVALALAGVLAFSGTEIDPNFVAGTVTVPAPGQLTMKDLDGSPRVLRLADLSTVRRDGSWNATPVAVGDCVYARGQAQKDRSILVDRLWANIASFSAEVVNADKGSILMRILSSGEQRSTGSGRVSVASSFLIRVGQVWPTLRLLPSWGIGSGLHFRPRRRPLISPTLVAMSR